MQEWVKQGGSKWWVLFEGRDAAGKGASSRRSRAPQPPGLPGHCPARPSDRERTQWYFQRYVAHLPSAGEMVLFDRPGTTGRGRTGDGLCSDDEYREFPARLP